MTTSHLFSAALAIVGTSATALAANHVVSKLTQTQRPGKKLMDTTCDVTAPAFELNHAE